MFLEFPVDGRSVDVPFYPTSLNLTEDWMFQHVVPNIQRKYPNDSRLCRVLTEAFLFAAMDPQLGEDLVLQALGKGSVVPTTRHICKQPSRIVKPMTPFASPRLAITNPNTSLPWKQVKDSRTCSHYTYGPSFVTKEPAWPN
jgi:hypothetical protein